MLAGGTVINVAVVIGNGWRWRDEPLLVLMTILAAIGYYVWGGRDSDTGAMYGGREDERQRLIHTQAAAFSGWVVCQALLAGFVVALALGKPTWPFAIFLGVGVISFIGATAFYRSRGTQ
jgi:hypothetical protein